MARLFADEPENAEGFRRLLGFCNGDKRTKRQIDEELAAICAAAPRSRHVSAAGIYPSYFTDRLEQCAGLVWEDGWTTTKEGAAFLAVFQ